MARRRNVIALIVAMLITGLVWFTGSRRAKPMGVLLSTVDGGKTWLVRRMEEPLNDIDFVSGTRGWAVGDAGLILATRDGGATWARQESGTKARLYGIGFADPLVGWAVGDSETILATKDGGATWRQVFGEIGREELFSLHVKNREEVWVVGHDDLVLHTSDGGSEWKVQYNGHSYDPPKGRFDVGFSDDGRGVAVGVWAAFQTTDGGERWKKGERISDLALMSVEFAGSTTGWAVGEQGTILCTTDAGVTWLAQHAGTTNDLMGVSFVDDRTGWAVGEDGMVVMTRDGGETWHVQVSGTMAWLRSVRFVDADRGWIAGRQPAQVSTDLSR